MAADQRLLIVDDNQPVREMLREIIRMLRPTWHVLEASNGAEGLAFAKAYRPAIIFMDLNMPVMNGYAAVVQIRATLPLRDIPVVLTTSEDVQAPLVVQTSALCQAVITKPFSIQELNQLLTYLLDSPPDQKQPPLSALATPLLLNPCDLRHTE